MAKGKKSDNELVYNIMNTYFIKGSFAEVSRILDVPETTVRDIVNKNKDKPEFEELRSKTINKFSEKFEKILNKAINRLDRELDEQDSIPVNQLSTVIGTIYDKNRLEQGQSTENTNNTITIGFSDEMQELSK